MEDRINGAPSTELVVASQADVNTYSNSERLNVADLSGNLTIANAYHLSEIQQNNTIITTAKGIIWAGFGVICFGVLFAIAGKVDVSLITTASGVITEIISAVVFAFVTQSNKSKLQYFNQLSLGEERESYMNTINTLDGEVKGKLLEKLIDNYCERSKLSK